MRQLRRRNIAVALVASMLLAAPAPAQITKFPGTVTRPAVQAIVPSKPCDTVTHHTTRVVRNRSIACFLEVVQPNTFQVASTMSSGNGWRDVVDDRPGSVPRGGHYAGELWYFMGAGVFTRYANFIIKLDTCTPSSASRFYCL